MCVKKAKFDWKFWSYKYLGNLFISKKNVSLYLPIHFGTARICVHLFSKIFGFRKNGFPLVFGVTDHKISIHFGIWGICTKIYHENDNILKNSNISTYCRFYNFRWFFLYCLIEYDSTCLLNMALRHFGIYCRISSQLPIPIFLAILVEISCFFIVF